MPQRRRPAAHERPDNAWPPAGTHLCRCLSAEHDKTHKYPCVILRWQTSGVAYEFDDYIWLTPRTAKRLRVAAVVLGALPATAKTPDWPDEALAVADRLVHNAPGKKAMVTVIRTRWHRRKLRQVAFSGYAAPSESPDAEGPPPVPTPRPAPPPDAPPRAAVVPTTAEAEDEPGEPELTLDQIPF